METRRRRHGLNTGDRPREAQCQIDRMNCLGDQNAAAIARQGAAARFIIIGLRTPPRHRNFAEPQRSERAAIDKLTGFLRCSPHAVLEDDAECDASVTTESHKTIGFLRIPGDGLFHQDVSARFRELSDDIDAGIRWRRDDGEIDIRIARRFLDRGINDDIVSGVFRRFRGQRPGAAGTTINDSLQANFLWACRTGKHMRLRYHSGTDDDAGLDILHFGSLLPNAQSFAYRYAGCQHTCVPVYRL
ncbi:hypothetical protein D3C86_1442030 [compost metagenome]